MAKDALLHAGSYSFAHRKDKKSHNRKLWNIKINAAARQNGLPYSQFINLLKKNKIELDRKVLSQLAEYQPAVFAKIVAEVKK